MSHYLKHATCYMAIPRTEAIAITRTPAWWMSPNFPTAALEGVGDSDEPVLVVVCPTIVAVTPVLLLQTPPSRGLAEDLNVTSAHCIKIIVRSPPYSTGRYTGVHIRYTEPSRRRRW